MTRVWHFVFSALLISCSLAAQQTAPAKRETAAPPAAASPDQKTEEPPEEDASFLPKEYIFNPLQATKEISTGRFYAHKGNWKAARGRFSEATKWNPGSAEAFYLLGTAEEKMNNKKAAKEAFEKYLSIEPDGKEAAAVKKRLAKL